MAAVALCAAAGLGASGHASASVDSATARVTGGTWSTPALVPGITALNVSGASGAQTSVVSCPTAAFCAAAGTYLDVHRHAQVFVVAGGPQAAGLARALPGLTTLNHGDALVTSLSCVAAGSCAMAGSYLDATKTLAAFVADEIQGVWHRAHRLLGVAGIAPQVATVSCAAPGVCAAVGASASQLPYVADEIGGTWGDAKAVPGLGALGTTGSLLAVSCAAPGRCGAGGFVGSATVPENPQPLVVDEVGGVWQPAEVPAGSGALNAGDWASVTALSCGAAGDCSAAGYYTDGLQAQQVFVATESGGTWGPALEVPGTAALNGGGWATIGSLACRGAAACSLAATASVHAGTGSLYVSEPVVAQESGGTWHAASVLPGARALPGANVTSLSCPTTLDCTAIGWYQFDARFGEPFAADRVAGVWHRATPIPGMHPFERPSGVGLTLTVSCGARLRCVAGGWIALAAGDRAEPFLLVESPSAPAPTVTRVSPATGVARGGTIVTVFGSGFTSVRAVRFGTRAASHVVVVNPGALRVTSPAGAGTVDVRVTTASGTSTTTSRSRFTYR